MGPFKLYPVERPWWSFEDYGAVLDAMARLQADGRPIARALEFGPGSSTLALIEGGARAIDTCEDDPAWARRYSERLVASYPGIVRVVRYQWVEPLSIPAIEGNTYDLALIDGPLRTEHRPAVLRYCLERSAAVLIPTEEIGNRIIRTELAALEATGRYVVDIRETGPLSGAFALVTPDPMFEVVAERVPAASMKDCP